MQAYLWPHRDSGALVVLRVVRVRRLVPVLAIKVDQERLNLRLVESTRLALPAARPKGPSQLRLTRASGDAPDLVVEQRLLLELGLQASRVVLGARRVCLVLDLVALVAAYDALVPLRPDGRLARRGPLDAGRGRAEVLGLGKVDLVLAAIDRRAVSRDSAGARADGLAPALP